MWALTDPQLILAGPELALADLLAGPELALADPELVLAGTGGLNREGGGDYIELRSVVRQG